MSTLTISAEEMTEAIERFYRLEHQVLDALRDINSTPRQLSLHSQQSVDILNRNNAQLSALGSTMLNVLNELQKLNKQTETILKETNTPKPWINNDQNAYSGINEFRYVYLRTKLTDFIDRMTDIPTSVIRDRVAAWIDYQKKSPVSHSDFMRMLYDAIVSWEEGD